MSDKKSIMIAASVTPFTKEGAPDPDSMRNIVTHVIGNGLDGLFMLGTMGEWNQLDFAEREILISAATEAMPTTGRLWLGISGVGLHLTLKNLEAASIHSCSGYVVMLPPKRMSMIPPVDYLHAVMDRADRDVYYYHAPGNNGIELSMPEFARIIEHPRCKGIKNSAGDITLRKKLLNLKKQHDFALFDGNEWSIDEALFDGCDGAVCGSGAFVPKMLSRLALAADAGDFATAKELQWRLTEIFAAIYGTHSWIGEKYALMRLGIIKSCHCRTQPEHLLPEEHRRAIESCLATLQV